jgi:hypothetical protein
MEVTDRRRDERYLSLLRWQDEGPRRKITPAALTRPT